MPQSLLQFCQALSCILRRVLSRNSGNALQGMAHIWRRSASVKIPDARFYPSWTTMSDRLSSALDKPCVTAGRGREIVPAVRRATFTEQGVPLSATPEDVLLPKHDEPIPHHRANTMRPGFVPTPTST
ncbi:hypothetical protein M3J09_002191 [Ascochyta lentis]